MWDLWTLPSLHVSLWRGSCQPVLGFLVVGGERGCSQVPISRWPLLQQHVLLEFGKMTNRFDHTQQNKSLQGNMIPGWVFVRRNSLCLWVCRRRAGRTWLTLEVGCAEGGFIFAHLLFAFFYTVHYCFCKDKAVGYLYSWNTLLYFCTVTARRKCV